MWFLHVRDSTITITISQRRKLRQRMLKDTADKEAWLVTEGG